MRLTLLKLHHDPSKAGDYSMELISIVRGEPDHSLSAAAGLPRPRSRGREAPEGTLRDSSHSSGVVCRTLENPRRKLPRDRWRPSLGNDRIAAVYRVPEPASNQGLPARRRRNKRSAGLLPTRGPIPPGTANACALSFSPWSPKTLPSTSILCSIRQNEAGTERSLGVECRSRSGCSVRALLRNLKVDWSATGSYI